jgi:flagellar basal-body rod modification protein FlgD
MANAIPPTAAPTTATPASLMTRQSPVGPGGKLGKDEFMRLLTTQLRYQDPMNPLDGHQLAADLAQFSGLEQLLNINDQLEAQKGQGDVILSAINNSVAMGTIGKTVVATGDQVVLADDGTGVIDGRIIADVAIEGNAVLEMLDDKGAVIGTRQLGYIKAAPQQTFDMGSAANGLTEGLYHARIVVTDGKGVATPQTTYFIGKVDGLSYSSTGAVLTSGPVDVSIGAIRRIIA